MTNALEGDDALQESIAVDLPCTQCGYNLRGLTPKGRCPECNTVIARSLHGRLLRASDPAWLRRVRLGTALVLVRILLLVAPFVLVITLSGPAMPVTITQSIWLASTAIWLVACMLLTTSEPAAASAGHDRANNTVLRICVTVQCAAIGLVHIVPGTGVLATAATSIAWLAGTASHFCLFRLLREFARRIPDDALGADVTKAMWGFLICYILWEAFDLFTTTVLGGATVFPASPGRGNAPWLIVPSCALGLGYVVFGLWYWVIVLQVHHGLGLAVRQAQQSLDADAQALIEIE